MGMTCCTRPDLCKVVAQSYLPAECLCHNVHGHLSTACQSMNVPGKLPQADTLLSREACAQMDKARQLPWSPAMAALFIDRTKLAQGSLLGSNRNTYSGTYTPIDSGQPIQVCRVFSCIVTYSGFQRCSFVVQMRFGSFL